MFRAVTFGILGVLGVATAADRLVPAAGASFATFNTAGSMPPRQVIDRARKADRLATRRPSWGSTHVLTLPVESPQRVLARVTCEAYTGPLDLSMSSDVRRRCISV